MSAYEFFETYIEGLYLITPKTFSDERGRLKKSFDRNEFEKHGIFFDIFEEIETTSGLGVLRGLHFMTHNPQAKLIRVSRGEIFDVAVDLRRNSKTFGRYYSTVLSEDNQKMLYIPEGFAHGCLTTKDKSTFYYLCSSPHNPNHDSGVIYNDADLNIDWPIVAGGKIVLSDKDRELMSFKDYMKSPSSEF